LPPPENAPDAVSRRELDDRLRLIEERIEHRQSDVLHRIDSVAQTVAHAVETLSTDIRRNNETTASNQKALREDIGLLRKEIVEISTKSSEDKRTILANLYAIVLASAIAGIVAIWATNSLIISSLQSGSQASLGGKDAKP
jgi:hypothetical protein